MAKKYSIGRGKIFVSRFKTGTQTPEGFRFVGNVPGFTLTVENETLDHYSSTDGIREKDESLILQTNRSGSLTMEELDEDNLALFFFGAKSTVSQSSGTGTVETIADVIEGYQYQIGRTTINPTGVRKVSSVVVNVGATTMTVAEDYTLDLERGLITIVEGGDINTGDDIEITYNRAAASRTQVISGTSQVEGALHFISTNPLATTKNDVYLPYVKFSPNGDFALITEEWAQLALSLEVLVPSAGGSAIYIDGQAVAA